VVHGGDSLLRLESYFVEKAKRQKLW
jgi:hypothetical protein